MRMSKVSIARYNGDMVKDIKESMELIGIHDKVVDKSIMIKVNACRPGYAPGQVTNPEFLKATIEILKEYTSDITVCEADGQRFSAWVALEKSGLKKATLEAGAKVINLSEAERITVKVPNHLHFETLELPEPLINTDVFIDMCLMKTHKLTDVTLGLKNLFGCIPYYDRVLMHKYIHELLPDAASVLKPDIALMDAIVGMEGDGPIAGIPKRLNLILCSDNVVALDYVAVQIMGFNPEKIKHISNAIKKLPIEPLHIYGCSVNKVKLKFKPAAYDLISKLEREVQRNAILSRFVYLNPTIFKIVKWTGWKLRDLTGYTKKYEKDLEKSGEDADLYDIIGSRRGD
jgi:uncharacterized protein (DUF362 family)